MCIRREMDHFLHLLNLINSRKAKTPNKFKLSAYFLLVFIFDSHADVLPGASFEA